MNRHDGLDPVRINRQWKNQKGMTGIGIAAILGMIAFFALIGMRLFPIYTEHFSVTTHLEKLETQSNIKNETDRKIIGKLMSSYAIDDVKNVKRENIFIERESGGGIIITIEYEVRTPAVGNIEMVVSFSDEVKIN